MLPWARLQVIILNKHPHKGTNCAERLMWIHPLFSRVHVMLCFCQIAFDLRSAGPTAQRNL